jgi:hypothetical protein
MRNNIFFFLFTILFAGTANAQTVSLKQIGIETVLFSDVFVEWFNQNLYTIENTGALYKTNLVTGSHTRLGNVTYKHTRYLFVVNAQLYCMEDDGSMNRIDINTGAWTVVSPIGTWNSINRVLTVGNKFYTTENGVLYYHPTMSERVKKQVGEADFYDLGSYSTTDTSLCTLIGGTLYQINTQTWKWKKIGPNKAWRFAKDGDLMGNKYYTVETPSALVETDLSTGTRKILDDKQFLNAALVIADSDKLYVIFKGGIIYEIIIN